MKYEALRRVKRKVGKVSDVDKEWLELAKVLETGVCPKCGADIQFVKHQTGEVSCSCTVCCWFVFTDKFLIWKPVRGVELQ